MSDNSATALAMLSEESRREYWSALALRHTEGLGSLSVCALLSYFGSAWEAVQNPYDWDEAGVSGTKVHTFLSEAWRKTARPEWDAARTFHGQIILWTDERYPQCLKELPDAPPLLYTIGDTSLLNAPCVALVGSRNASQAAMDFASSMAESLSLAGVTVVSGMAFGIDGRAQRSALRGPGRTIAVLAGGADVPYPAHHTELWRKIAAHGLIVSEAAPGATAHTKAFPRRNRIVSGLSLGVLVAEASSEKSGSLITARLAVEQGRAVYVPAPDALHGPYAEGTKKLLMEGARPVWQSGDILADLFPHLRHALDVMPKTSLPQQNIPKEAQTGVQPEHQFSVTPSAPSLPSTAAPSVSVECVPELLSRPVSSLSPDEEYLLSLLTDAPLSPDELLTAAQEHDGTWTAPRLLSTLMVMEVRKYVRRLSDSRYEVRP